MKLHENKEAFTNLIVATSDFFGIDTSLIEKDYYVTLLLQKVQSEISGIIFKGGTSLSKCHKIIDRFSEDIDLTLDNEHFTQSKKIHANKMIIEICDEFGFVISNRETIEKHSHGDYNVYNIEYPISFPSSIINPELKLEMVFKQKAYPSEKLFANSYIGDFLQATLRDDIVNMFDLQPFEIQVQSLERTLVDKIFAICDYSMRDETRRNSRHLYDIARILPRVNLDENLRNLVQDVRKDRKKNVKYCPSAQDGIIINEVLQNIISKNIFEKDYENSTRLLLMHPFEYDETIKSIQAIIDSNVFCS